MKYEEKILTSSQLVSIVLNETEASPYILSKKLGFGKNTVKMWSKGTSASVDNLDKMLSLLGYEIRVVKKGDKICL